jgi:calcineurin-like phosphoesterase family protein
MSTVFFTSDEHIGHRNVLKFCNRPFSDLGEMKDKLIANHNSVVNPGDRVYHLGDMFWRTVPVREALDYRYALNGEHYFIWGNHDELIERNKILHDSFKWCRDVENLKVDGYPSIWLSHYAHRVWNGSHRGTWHLYGHSHSQLPEVNPTGTMDESPLSFDVGVDAIGYFPVSIDQVKAKMDAKQDLWKPKKFNKEWKKETDNG